MKLLVIGAVLVSLVGCGWKMDNRADSYTYNESDFAVV